MKKILALVCSVVMIVSMFSITANAAVDGCSVTASAVVENVGGYDYIKLVISATIPDTLVAYTENQLPMPPFTTTYGGLMMQTAGFDITIPSGLTYIAAMSSVSEPLTLNKDNASLYKLYYANTGDKSTYYAGDVATLATLYFWTADLETTYNFDVNNAVIGLVDVNTETGAIAPREYTFNDFTITNATFTPETQEPDVNTVAAAETIKTDVMTSQEPAGYEKGQGFALRFAAGDVANFTKMIWALTVDGAKKYSDAVAFNAASIADNAQVEVAATFLNQNEAAVSAVNAIFCTEDGTEYFTDAADADNKAE